MTRKVVILIVALMLSGFFVDAVSACQGLQFNVDKEKLAKSLSEIMSGEPNYRYWTGYVTPSGLCTLKEVWVSPAGDVIELDKHICDFIKREAISKSFDTKYAALVIRREILRKYLNGERDAFGEWKYEVYDTNNPDIKLVIPIEVRPGLPNLPPSSEIEKVIEEATENEFRIRFQSWDSPSSHVAYITSDSLRDSFEYNCPGVENVEKQFEGIHYIAELIDPSGAVYDKTSFAGYSSGVSFKVSDKNRPGYWKVVVYVEGYEEYYRSVKFYVSPEETKAVNVQATCGPGLVVLLAVFVAVVLTGGMKHE